MKVWSNTWYGRAGAASYNLLEKVTFKKSPVVNYLRTQSLGYKQELLKLCYMYQKASFGQSKLGFVSKSNLKHNLNTNIQNFKVMIPIRRLGPLKV